MATERTKTSWAILAAGLFAIGLTGYTTFVSRRTPVQKLPAVAKVGFVIFFTTGTACSSLWVYFGFAAKSRRKPGVSWMQANAVFDLDRRVLYLETKLRITFAAMPPPVQKDGLCPVCWMAAHADEPVPQLPGWALTLEREKPGT